MRHLRIYSVTALLLTALILNTTGASASSRPLTGFLSTPTDQLAVPGLPAGAEITPEGDLYTGWAEYELRFGRSLAAWDQPTRTLPNPALPELSSTSFDGPVGYTVRVFAVPIAGEPVAYETVTAVNGSAQPHEAQVAMSIAYTRGRQIRGPYGSQTGAYRYERPVNGGSEGAYEQLGQAFSSSFVYDVLGRDLDRSGLLLARGPAMMSRPLQTPASNTQTSTHDGRLFKVRLAGHAQASLTWQIPLRPPETGERADRELDGMSLSRASAKLRSLWSAQEAGMMGISVPEEKVDATYRAAITQILDSRYLKPAGWVQSPNRLQYRAFWIRDAAIETQALDLAGLHAAAAQNLSFVDTFQEPDGLFISQAGQYDGLGQALWALSQHAELTQDPLYAAAQLGRLGAAIGWLSAATAIDPLGLLPPSNPNDNELAYGHITGDDLWAAIGLRSAIADATLAGRSDLAAAWSAVDTHFESSLDRAITAAVTRAGHIPPVLDAAGGQDWGNYWAAFPLEILGANSPEVTATMTWARSHLVQGLPTYQGSRSLHDYLGFKVFQTELAAGDPSGAIAGLYAELAHTTATDGGWEVISTKQRSSATNLSPHGTFSAEYVSLLRNMLISENASGGLSLLAGASPAWQGAGQHITVTAAPTEHGVISFTERSSKHGETLSWQSMLPAGTALRWMLPGWARNIHSAAGAVSHSTLELHSSSGSATVTFDGHRPVQSYALAVDALNVIYREHGRSAPLVPASR